MAAIRGRGNKATEIRLVSIFRRYRIAGWRRHYPVEGRPDFAFPKLRLAVFADGCFWHGCPWHGHTPRSNRKYWVAKLERNRRRDRLVGRRLRTAGWRVLRIWAHELKTPERVVARIRRSLARKGTGRINAPRPK